MQIDENLSKKLGCPVRSTWFAGIALQGNRALEFNASRLINDWLGQRLLDLKENF